VELVAGSAHICMGSIVDLRHILTTASCLRTVGDNPLQVRVGKYTGAVPPTGTVIA
jgi:hypothetical protein